MRFTETGKRRKRIGMDSERFKFGKGFGAVLGSWHPLFYWRVCLISDTEGSFALNQQVFFMFV